MKQLLVDENWEEGKSFYLKGKAFRYLSKVRRVNEGEKLSLLTRDEVACSAEILSIQEDSLLLQMKKIEAFEQSGNLLPLRFTLCAGLLKGRKSDDTIRHAVQCGADEIAIIKTQHSVFEVKQEKSSQRISRWNRVATEASQQSGNPHQIKINYFDSLEDFFSFNRNKRLKGDTFFGIVFHEQQIETKVLHEIVTDMKKREAKRIFLFIGPEGGFSKEEVELFRSFSFSFGWLGPMVLRAENAVTAALSSVSLLFLEEEKWQTKNQIESNC